MPHNCMDSSSPVGSGCSVRKGSFCLWCLLQAWLCHSTHSKAIHTASPCQDSTLSDHHSCPAQVGAWGNCSQSCGTGVANRSVICIDSGGATVNSTLCPGLQPEHQAYCLNKECDFCSTTDCSKQVTTGHALQPPAATSNQRVKQIKLQKAQQWQHCA